MPVVERDPWRMQYFADLECPEDVIIPTEDADAYQMFPQFHWIYNKMQLAQSQGLVSGLHGIDPPSFPVFSKPIYNLKGMGVGSRALRSAKEYERYQKPGHFWTEMLVGEHISSDVAVVQGEPLWWRHVKGQTLDEGTFDYWFILAESRPELETYCGDWMRQHLQDYTGMVNLETIGGRIIEGHLRFADQWPDLYGPGWLDALVNLYKNQVWHYDDRQRRDAYSVVLFGAHGVTYRHPDPSLINQYLQHPQISSIQVTFHEDKPLWMHSMPPGGFRLLIVNCWDLEAGFEARRELALAFWSAQQLRPKRKSVVKSKD